MKERLLRQLSAIDESLGHLAATARNLAVWPVLIAMASGSAAWALRHWSRLAGVSKNELNPAERLQLLVYVGVAAGLWLLVLAASAAVRRWRSGAFGLARSVAELSRSTTFLIAVPFLVALALPKIEQTSPKLTFFFIGCAAAACLPTILTLARERPPSLSASDPPRWQQLLLGSGRWLAPLAVLCLAALYAWYFSRLSITNHRAFNTRTTDLGYYDNIFYQTIHGRFLGCTFIRAGYHGSAHFDPILAVLSPLYLLYPRAEMLLILQST